MRELISRKVFSAHCSSVLWLSSITIETYIFNACFDKRESFHLIEKMKMQQYETTVSYASNGQSFVLGKQKDNDLKKDNQRENAMRKIPVILMTGRKLLLITGRRNVCRSSAFLAIVKCEIIEGAHYEQLAKEIRKMM